MFTKLSAFVFVGLSYISQPVNAEIDIGRGVENFAPGRVLNNQDGLYDYWGGVGRIQSPTRCVGTLLDTRVDGVAKGPAYVLTNGHCVSWDGGEILRNTDFEGTIQFKFFTGQESTAKAYPFKKVNWSSMRGVDLAILELQASLASVIEDGVQPLLFGQRPDEGTDILVVGSKGIDPLQVAACQLESSPEVVEGVWVWRHTMKNKCKGIGPGSSGSPIIERSTNKIVGLLNTEYDYGAYQCGIHMPCQIKDGKFYTEITNYGISTDRIDRCFVDGVFSEDPARCVLFPAYSIVGDVARQQQYYLPEDLTTGSPAVYPKWNMRFTLDKPFYRYKVTRRPRTCEVVHGYSDIIDSANAYINDEIGPQVGIHTLCVIGVDSRESLPFPGVMRNALNAVVELKAADKNVEPLVRFRSNWFGRYAEFRRAPPSRNQFFMKYGQPAQVDCTTQDGYTEVEFKEGQGTSVVKLEPRPGLVCVYSKDIRGTSSPVETYP